MLSRRLILAAAFAGFFAHAATIYLLGDSMPGPLLTDLIELAMGIGVTLTAFYAAKRSEAYARKVWMLATLALGLYAVGLGLVTYYRHIAHTAYLSPWFSAQFFFFWVVPLVLAD